MSLSEDRSSRSCEQPLAGQLMKFTNVVKGWQYRWFVLNPATADLRYYLTQEQQHSVAGKPRGMLHLVGALVYPSEEDVMAFTVQPIIGEAYKLKAIDAREKQLWISRLQAVAEDSYDKKSRMSSSVPRASRPVSSMGTGSTRESTVLHNLQKLLTTAADQRTGIYHAVDALPTHGPLAATERDVLILKATADCLLHTLDQCAHLLYQCQGAERYHAGAGSAGSESGGEGGAVVVTRPTSLPDASSPSSGTTPELGEDALVKTLVDDYNTSEEQPDQSPVVQPGLLPDLHSSNLLTFLTQLKLGADLTRVSLPVYVTSGISLLEMYSEFFACADLFAAITCQSTPERRMAAVLKWFTCALYFGCAGGQLRKPFNPALGEVFRCSWASNAAVDTNRVDFVAEQVSHHPLVTALFAACTSRRTYFNGHVWVKAKLLGTSVQMNLLGQATLLLQNHGETYVLTYPTAFARSVLNTAAWFELGGKMTVTCAQSGVSALCVFATKPFHGGKLHRISGEIKNRDQETVCRMTGEWNNGLEFVWCGGAAQEDTVNVAAMHHAVRLVRPVERQHALESRRFWQPVREALRSGDLNACHAAFKRQQDVCRILASRANEATFGSTFFSQDGSTWTYKKMPQLP